MVCSVLNQTTFAGLWDGSKRNRIYRLLVTVHVWNRYLSGCTIIQIIIYLVWYRCQYFRFFRNPHCVIALTLHSLNKYFSNNLAILDMNEMFLRNLEIAITSAIFNDFGITPFAIHTLNIFSKGTWKLHLWIWTTLFQIGS